MEINKYIKELINNEKECDIITDKLINDGFDFFREEHLGFIQEETLLMLIQKSKRSKVLQCFLANLSYCLTADEVTPQIFELLLKFKGKFKSTILMALSHAPLSIYQLQTLSKFNIDDQAFCQLVLVFCRNDCFSKNDLINLLQKNIANKSQLPCLYEEICKDNSFDATKIELLRNFLKN